MKLVKINSFLLNSIRMPRKQNLLCPRSLLKVVEKPAMAKRVAAMVSTRAERNHSMANVVIAVLKDIARRLFQEPKI